VHPAVAQEDFDMERPRPLRTVFAAALLGIAGAGIALAQAEAVPPEIAPPVFAGTAQVTAVELLVEVTDRAGVTPKDLTPDDFEVIEEGERVELVGVERVVAGAVRGAREAATPPADAAPDREEPSDRRSGWRLVVWFDQELSSTRSIRRTAEELAARARLLAELGEVEIVVAGDGERVACAPTRSSPAIEKALLEIARDVAGRDGVRAIRRTFLERMLLKGELDARNMPQTVRTPAGPGGGGGGAVGEGAGLEATRDPGSSVSRRSQIREAFAGERMLLTRRRDLLLTGLAARGLPGAKALLLVNDGWDLDPRDFYLAGSPGGATDFFADLSADVSGEEGGAPIEALGRALAASGWVGITVASGALEAGVTVSAELSGRGRLGEIMSGGEDSLSELPSALVYRPLEPLRAIADATGGEVLTGVGALGGALERLRDRIRLTYQVSRPPDAKLRRVEVRSLRAGLEVRAPRWTGATDGEELAAARARALVGGREVRGDLPLTAALVVAPPGDAGTDAPAEAEPAARRRQATLQARLDLAPVRAALAGAEPSSMRLTLAVSYPSAPPFVIRDVLDGQRLAGLSAWTWSAPLALPADFERVAVVLEESRSGAFGAALAARVEGAPAVPAATAGAVEFTEEQRAAALVELLPGREPVVLPPLGEGAVTGEVRIEPLAVGPEVARVDYLLDGERLAAAAKAPFAGKLDFGALPVPRRLEAVAFDAAGRELGRDAVELNSGAAPFAVRIVEPRGPIAGGAVDLEAEVTLPADARLDRVEVYRGHALEATLYAPPFRHRLYLPGDAAGGFVAVVAHAADGTTVEDVRAIGDPGLGERVEVRLVEVVAVVAGADGRPVRGLGAGDFELAEDGAGQRLESVRDGSELPLTVGLAIDSSASLFEEMSRVQAAAVDFLALPLEATDRAFVVDFDSEPRLAADLSGSLGELTSAIGSLRPGGSTALCDALVYSLARLGKVRGRRGLVMLTDGLGGADRTSMSACQRFVERSGVPVYLLLLPESGPKDERRAAEAAEKLARLVAPSGGRLIRVEDVAKLGGVYREIREELAAQYVLSYYPSRQIAPAELGGAGWRRIAVAVRAPGLGVRAAAGWRP
jgi:Ca-activated chloride channel family protein